MLRTAGDDQKARITEDALADTLRCGRPFDATGEAVLHVRLRVPPVLVLRHGKYLYVLYDIFCVLVRL
ncbi:unnamed protein product [Pylaiella littoralis]